MKRICFLRCIAIALLVCTVFSLAAFAAEEKVDYGAKLDRALGLYIDYGLFSNDETDYVRDALIKLFEEDGTLFYKFMNSIYESNDRYSHYMAPEVYDNAYVMQKSMVGIGVVISYSEEDGLVINSVSEGPAKEAGIKPGDIIVSVDGIDVRTYVPEMVGGLIRGEEGTKVKVDVMRTGERKSFNITRRKITVSSVSASKVSEKVGYIKLEHFDGINAFMDFMDAYDDFRDSGINTVVLDLRDNMGGGIDCLVNLMDNIIPEKDIPYLMTWSAKPMKLNTFMSEGYGFEFNKFVILVNENTASAAEMMAGALQDLGYADVVGKTTYGKGMGQLHMQLEDGDEAVITTMQMKLPTSGSYDGIGIIPDYDVDLDIKPYTLPYLIPLKEKSDISPIKRDNLRAVEQRLSELGYLYGEPDDVWDTYTLYAINMFCRDEGLMPISSRCSWELIEKIDEATKALTERYVVTDTQLEKALELAEKYAQSDEKAKCNVLEKIDFRAD